VFVRSGGKTKRASVGTINGNGAFDATFVGASPDGSRLLWWQYVVDQRVADAYMVEMWGVAGAAAYERVLTETGNSKLAWEAARSAQEEAT
jgi:hypothetical protein